MRIRFRSLLFSSVTFKVPTKTKFLSPCFYAYSFLKVHFHNSSKMKSPKEVKFFCLFMEGSGYGSLRINYGSGCGSRRPKNIRIGSGTLIFCSCFLCVSFQFFPADHCQTTKKFRLPSGVII